jgi:serine phosphatase RsbU (regulator of sigma subunit)
LPPNEVLARFNRALIEQRLLEDSMLTIAYASLNFQDGMLRFARAGQPAPLHVPAQGAIQQWSAPGPMLGVFEAEFPLQARTLRPGDKVVFFSDGIDSIQLGSEAAGLPSLSACALRHRDLPLRNFVDALANDLLRQTPVADDVTLLGLEWPG